MLTVVTWLWQPHKKYRTQYGVLHVELMRQRIREHCTLEHEFVCITDRPAEEFSRHVRVVPLWEDHKTLPPAFHRGPSCYRRLRIFAAEAHELLGVRAGSTVVSIDLDTVVVGGRDSLDVLWDRGDEFVGWRASDRAPCCGSMFLLKLGALPHVWSEFRFDRALASSKRTGFVGTDQAWMAAHLAESHGSWGKADGVYSFKDSCREGLPENARVVFFHGKPDPWDADVRRDHAWIRERYPLEPLDALPEMRARIESFTEAFGTGDSGVNCRG